MSENPPASPLEPPYDPWRLERLLDGREPVADPADQALARLLAAASAPATDAELRGQDAVVAAFRAHHAGQPGRALRRSRRVPRVTALAAGAAGAVLLGGVAAAYTGSLPTPVQNVAHHVIGAPAAGHGHAGQPASPAAQPDHGPATPTTTVSPTQVGPNTTAATTGLCEAYASGGLAPSSVGYQSLARAAGPTAITHYCANLTAPDRTNPPGSHAPTTPPGSPAPGAHTPAGRSSAGAHPSAPATRPSLPPAASSSAHPSLPAQTPHQVATVDR
jgi:hypothetical protein